ncbi:hypothetical protein EG68_05011 [Paragonimus skrjabini miyazakii]|uniref:Uncharacterized protein n=1 Tax=Paragonimus skrjabini miyazakii TaxID=59628 RepID=A0A8S9Z0G6_9TREM|nr:hypothetical protein EG68_05011 [Paragonimus skrjabini miyazakii]
MKGHYLSSPRVIENRAVQNVGTHGRLHPLLLDVNALRPQKATAGPPQKLFFSVRVALQTVKDMQLPHMNLEDVETYKQLPCSIVSNSLYPGNNSHLYWCTSMALGHLVFLPTLLASERFRRCAKKAARDNGNEIQVHDYISSAEVMSVTCDAPVRIREKTPELRLDVSALRYEVFLGSEEFTDYPVKFPMDIEQILRFLNALLMDIILPHDLTNDLKLGKSSVEIGNACDELGDNINKWGVNSKYYLALTPITSVIIAQR